MNSPHEMFIPPCLAKCADRSQMPKSHPNSGGPEDWFSDHMLARHQYLGLTFDFFVNWSKKPEKLTPVIWIKKILASNYTYASVIENLTQALTSHLDQAYLSLLDAFKNQHALKVQFIIFRDDYNWSDETSDLLIISFEGKNGDTFDFSPEVVSLREFKLLIQQYSGGPIQIGSKGLIYGTSNLECFLSNTSSLYPGDVDLLLFNLKHEPLAILEFKKHTLDSPISNQQLSNYYPSPDSRKYNRLSVLRDYINPKLPLFNIYYPTQKSLVEGKIELLKGSNGDLCTHIGRNFTLPKCISDNDFDPILAKLTKAISYHMSIS